MIEDEKSIEQAERDARESEIRRIDKEINKYKGLIFNLSLTKNLLMEDLK